MYFLHSLLVDLSNLEEEASKYIHLGKSEDINTEEIIKLISEKKYNEAMTIYLECNRNKMKNEQV